MSKKARKIELLSPAKDKETAFAAINAGADAVYIGATSYGARASAANTIEDIESVVEYAHIFGVKVYVTINTILYDAELKDVEALIWELYKIGVDALIVQDMSILRMNLPPIALHSSTQCDLRTVEKAKFLQAVGFSQLVMARELSIKEINDISSAVDVPLEAFIHGALCVCYSGRCQASEAFMHRSANRGECAQICRLSYDIEDENGNVLIHNKHLLSLRDFNMSGNLLQLLEAGVTSLKIEGRLKDIEYVKNVTSVYRKLLDNIFESDTRFERSSRGKTLTSYTPDLKKSFNRGFTQYFSTSRCPINGKSMASIHTPKSLGEKIGQVKRIKGNTIEIDTSHILNNGDGLSFFNKKREYSGFRVNTASGKTIATVSRVDIAPGTILYRTKDKAFDDAVSATKSAERKISVNMALRYVNNMLVLDAIDEYGVTSTITQDIELEVANTDQKEKQVATLSKLGNTVFVADKITILCDKFIPGSVLTQLKNQMCEEMLRLYRINHKYDTRKSEDVNYRVWTDRLTSADNVANHLAREFYLQHGAEEIEPAIEIKRITGEHAVMHTRYCIRRELGACLKSKENKKLPRIIYLTHGNIKMLVDCDCKNCEMRLIKQ